MPSKLKHFLCEYPGDRKIITKNIAQDRQKTNAELIETYNKQHALGLVGYWPQALLCFSLYIIFKERFEKSPVFIENFVLTLTESIVEIGGSYEYVEAPESGKKKIYDLAQINLFTQDLYLCNTLITHLIRL